MQPLRFYSLGAVTLYLLSALTISYAYFTANPTGASTGTAPSGQAASPVMTPDQFSSKVKSLSQKTQTHLNQQAKDIMSKPLVKQSGPNMGTQPGTHTESTPEAQTVSASPSPAAQPSQPQPYTGFGAGQGSPPQRPSRGNQPASGGWNVQY